MLSHVPTAGHLTKYQTHGVDVRGLRAQSAVIEVFGTLINLTKALPKNFPNDAVVRYA